MLHARHFFISAGQCHPPIEISRKMRPPDVVSPSCIGIVSECEIAHQLCAPCVSLGYTGLSSCGTSANYPLSFAGNGDFQKRRTHRQRERAQSPTPLLNFLVYSSVRYGFSTSISLCTAISCILSSYVKAQTIRTHCQSTFQQKHPQPGEKSPPFGGV